MEVFEYRPIFRLLSLLMNPNEANTVMFIISCFTVAVMIFVVFPIRESAQGYMAKFLGDDTAERYGRLTLNPLVHIDRMGALMMLIAPIGWGKPIPVNPAKCRKVKGNTAVVLIALSGPLANIVLAYLFMVTAKIILLVANEYTQSIYYCIVAVKIIIQLNIFIAVLNLLPIPQFAGGKILFAYLKPRTAFKIMQYQQIITLAFIFLLFWRNSPLSILLEFLCFNVIKLLDLLSKFIG
ncbi:MAG: site-2 protease family protein [Oscillospiraceae bacterium]|nr:site-2 protease family protein [Oscillospiraceae bacterium]